MDIKDLKECKICHQPRIKVLYATYNNVKQDKIYVDENNKRWNGKICPDCHKEQVKLKLRSKRQNAQNV